MRREQRDPDKKASSQSTPTGSCLAAFAAWLPVLPVLPVLLMLPVLPGVHVSCILGSGGR